MSSVRLIFGENRIETYQSKSGDSVSSHATLRPSNIRFWNRFTLGRLFGLTFCFATLFGLGVSWILNFIFALAVVYFISELLVNYLPSQIENRLQLNCVRIDGSWSDRRQRLEAKAVNKLRWDIRVVLLLVVIPTTLLIWLVDQEVAPIGIGLSAVSEMSVSSEQWKADLAEQEHQFDSWSKRKHGNTDATEHKQLLWKNWPLIVMAGIGWLVAGWLFVYRMFIYQLKDLVKGIEYRKSQYTLADYSRFDEGYS